jgi:hypothetical protein
MPIEISRRNFHVKRTSISILAISLIAVSLFSSSCGTGDKIQSLEMQVAGVGTGTINLSGLGGTLQLQVVTVYTSGKQIDQTAFSTYTVAPTGFYYSYDVNGNPTTQNSMPTPPDGITLNSSGMITAVDPGVCSWVNVGASASSPAWAYTGYYQINANFRGFTSNPVYIPLASAASGASNTEGACGPSATN